ncbi:class I SAM-dependent methyltransferase [Candidatus Wolfebacteria bacterium]|nr:class I SAM-dependent methyltransferase [Candidatus Wolfebacteria bacterium]
MNYQKKFSENSLPKTSWGKVADWYDDLLKQEGTYQKDLILPNLLRLLDIKKNEIIFDIACGQGFFAREFYREFLKKGVRVIGSDISKELIAIARKNSPKEIKFEAASADKLDFLAAGSVDKITIIMAIQNIENVSEVLKECERVLKPAGKLLMVMSHPAFRVPKQSSWGYDEKNKIQYRRIDSYLSESKVKIQMHPGDKPSEYTISFHRPLQFYFKLFGKNNFCVSRLEEWNSNRKSQLGPRAAAEDKSRKEIPLFIFMEAVKARNKM